LWTSSPSISPDAHQREKIDGAGGKELITDSGHAGGHSREADVGGKSPRVGWTRYVSAHVVRLAVPFHCKDGTVDFRLICALSTK
jgi:hypothetical protein